MANVPEVHQFLWQVNGIVGGSPATGVITIDGTYTAPSTNPASAVQVGIRRQTATATVSFFDPTHLSAGSVATTQNPLVAAYTISAPVGSAVQVQFGTDTTYGLSTSPLAAPSNGGAATVLVAGMYANTTYHMQAIIRLPDGSSVTDADHTFTTGAIPAANLPNITTQLTGVGTPSPGIELLSLIPSSTNTALCAVATDLAGNVIWYYDLPLGAFPEPIKLLPNGHLLLLTSGAINDVREIDLAGNLIRRVTTDQLTASLANIPSFQNAVWQNLNHDFLLLPNGHLILLASIQETLNNTSGIPPGTAVWGNELIDWDPQRGAVWTWSTFDHLDPTYAPYGLPDWTHGNALIYTSDDGNLIFSMRNQNSIVKINYQNGSGDGSILWQFGPNGDFTLPNQEAPIEWNYGQHYPTILGPNTSGVFSFMFFNNGNNRLVDTNNDICGSPGLVACYSSVPIFELNEYTKTASLVWENNLSPAYSTCCGDAQLLPNGNVEFDVAADVNAPNVSYIEEVSQTQTPELVWKMNIQGQLAYRGMRIPSLYPGQVWPASAQQNVQPAISRSKTQAALSR